MKVLIDSSVWINHLRADDERLKELVRAHRALVHPIVIGELAVGNLARRREFLDELSDLPSVKEANHFETLMLVERENLHGRGIGYQDAQLLAAVRLTEGSRFWTVDKRLAAVTSELGLAAVLDH